MADLFSCSVPRSRSSKASSMASKNPPVQPSAEAAPPGQPAGTIPLPPRPAVPPPAAPPALRRGLAVFDAVLVAVVLLLALLVASFPARNSDLWLHLATGRLLAERKLDFGSDPFAYTTAGALWVNHSWVADLLFYSLYQIGGGLGLGLFRALLVVFLALLLVQ